METAISAKSRKVVAAVSNLFFVAKMQTAARHAHTELVFVTSLDELMNEASLGAELVVLDLSDETLDGVESVKRLRSRPETSSVPLLGFLRHTHTAIAEEARAAGCERVLPRSEFSARLVDLLRGS